MAWLIKARNVKGATESKEVIKVRYVIESFSLPKGQLPYKFTARGVETQSVPFRALEHLEYFRTVETLSFRFNLSSLFCCFLCGGVLSYIV